MENQTQEDELEYNDGLGDMLRQKEHLEFSWVKTALVVLAIIIVVVIAVVFGSHYAQNMTSKPKPSQTVSGVSATQLKTQLDQLEEEYNALKKQNALLKQALLAKSNPTPAKTTSQKMAQKAPAKITQQPAKAVTVYPYKVIAGVFTDRSFAKTFSDELKAKNLNTYVWTHTVGGKNYYRVQVGAFPTKAEAESHALSLKKYGLSAYVMKK